jgi:hypothetical protein
MHLAVWWKERWVWGYGNLEIDRLDMASSGIDIVKVLFVEGA